MKHAIFWDFTFSLSNHEISQSRLFHSGSITYLKWNFSRVRNNYVYNRTQEFLTVAPWQICGYVKYSQFRLIYQLGSKSRIQRGFIGIVSQRVTSLSQITLFQWGLDLNEVNLSKALHINVKWKHHCVWFVFIESGYAICNV